MIVGPWPLLLRILVSALVSHQPQDGRILLLAKTTESFKLADLQTLEVELQAKQSGMYECKRLLLDQATGSCLFSLQRKECVSRDSETNRGDNTLSPSFLQIMPSSFSRCQWIGKVHAHHNQVEQFLDHIKDSCVHPMVKGPWTLDYLKLDPPNMATIATTTTITTTTCHSYTSRTLLCSVAQRIPSPPAAIHPSQATDRLLIVDLGLHQGLFLLEQLSVPQVGNNQNYLTQVWSTRPYQYSSAVNFGIAEIVVDLLQSTMLSTTTTTATNTKQRPPVLWDPTCGSGSFLAVGLDRGFDVVGCDVNPKCIAGTQRNLEHLLLHTMQHQQETTKTGRYQLFTGDSSQGIVAEEDQAFPLHIDCVVSNLPWGLNSVQHESHDNQRILRRIRQTVLPGTPCAFVVKQEIPFLSDLGFLTLGMASVPPADFDLPQSKKVKAVKATEASQSATRRNACLVILTRAV